MISWRLVSTLSQNVSFSVAASGSLSESAYLKTMPIFLSSPFGSTLPLPAATLTATAADAGSDSGLFSLGTIFEMAGGVFAIALGLAIGFVLLRFHRSQIATIASPDDAVSDDESVEGTLHQTLFPFSESVTMEAARAAPLLVFLSTSLVSFSALP
jgi:hypothetical protein